MVGAERPSPGDSLEGWTAAPIDAAELAEIVEKAFDYRGDVTVATRDGGHQVGYLFNRDRHVSQPFLQMLPSTGGPPQSIFYADIVAITFTGKDTASGKSYAAWRKRKEAERAGVIVSPESPSDAAE